MKTQLTCFFVSVLLLLAAGAPAQNLFVADIFANNITEITPGGARSTFASGLNYPYGLAFNSVGDLFVANSGNNTIIEITPGGAQSIFASGSLLNGPLGLAFNSAGDLFVADSAGFTYEYTPGGAQTTFASGPSSAGLAFNSAGDLFEAGVDSGSIVEFTPAGAPFLPFFFASGLLGPTGLAFNSEGDLFAADQYGFIYQYTPGGAQSTFTSYGAESPCGLAFNSAGVLFESDSATGDIYEFTPDGTPFLFASGLNGPLGLAFQPATAQTMVYVGNPALPFVPFFFYAQPDGVPPLVIMGEYSPAGPLPDTTQPLPEGTVQDVKFYGQNYDFTLYALRHLTECSDTNEQIFRVVAAQHFSGTSLAPGTITLAVSNFCVRAGDFLAFAGIGPYYPQQPNDALNTDATYEDALQSDPINDNDTATPPVLGEKFTVGLNRDPNATYGYIADNFGNQGRIYAVGVDVLRTEERHDHRRFDDHDDHDGGDHQPPGRDWDSGPGDQETGDNGLHW